MGKKELSDQLETETPARIIKTVITNCIRMFMNSVLTKWDFCSVDAFKTFIKKKLKFFKFMNKSEVT